MYVLESIVRKLKPFNFFFARKRKAPSPIHTATRESCPKNTNFCMRNTLASAHRPNFKCK